MPFIARDDDGRCYAYRHSPSACPGGFTKPNSGYGVLNTVTARILGIPLPKPGEMIEWSPTVQKHAVDVWIDEHGGLRIDYSDGTHQMIPFKNVRDDRQKEDAQAAAPEPEPEPGEEKTCATCKWQFMLHCAICKGFSPWEPKETPETAPDPEPPAETLVEITSMAQLKEGDKVRCKASTENSFVLAVIGGLIALSMPGIPSNYDDWWTLEELNEAGFRQVITTPRTLSREEARKALDDRNVVKRIEDGTTYRIKGSMLVGEGDVNGVAYVWSVIKDRFDIPEGRYEIVKGGE